CVNSGIAASGPDYW
nr:immunoglobulin heavy chain junction region [Macaca mulatta]